MNYVVGHFTALCFLLNGVSIMILKHSIRARPSFQAEYILVSPFVQRLSFSELEY
jgi:hypothetical protein